jgi:hypothetical protein
MESEALIMARLDRIEARLENLERRGDNQKQRCKIHRWDTIEIRRQVAGVIMAIEPMSVFLTDLKQGD